MISIIEKRPILTIFLVVFFMLIIHLDIPNITIMEARNFITSREMIQDNNWILTTMNGEPRYQKPPLPTWLTAFSGLIFGAKSLWALRLPAALFVFVCGAFMYLISKQLTLSKQQSLVNGLITVTSFYVFAITNEGPWDIFAHGFMLIAIYFLIDLFQVDKKRFQNGLWAGFFIGCSILSKGPVSLFALLLPFLIAYGIVYKYRNFTKKILPLFGMLLILVLVGASWFLYIRLEDPETFLAITKRETGNWTSYNVRPFYYYWSFFIQSGIWAIPALIGLIYPYISKKTTIGKHYKFSFLWTILAVVLLSIIPEKKARYLMPVLLPLAMNTGVYIHYLIHQFKQLSKKSETLPVYVGFGLIALIGIISPIGVFLLLKDAANPNWISGILTGLVLASLGILIVIHLKNKKFSKVFYLTITFMVSAFLFGLPLTKTLNSNPNFNHIDQLKKLEVQYNITSYGFSKVTPELVWGYDGILKNIHKNQEFELPKEASFGLLVDSKHLATFKEKIPEGYTIEKITIFNHNYITKERNRLISHYFIISK
ncbi:MAG: glycosyltransferase [Flavobacteriaceae bacterium]|nr:MAG: glycosyltransferase [Flavobacteriaceae bacterium]